MKLLEIVSQYKKIYTSNISKLNSINKPKSDIPLHQIHGKCVQLLLLKTCWLSLKKYIIKTG